MFSAMATFVFLSFSCGGNQQSHDYYKPLVYILRGETKEIAAAKANDGIVDIAEYSLILERHVAELDKKKIDKRIADLDKQIAEVATRPPHKDSSMKKLTPQQEYDALVEKGAIERGELSPIIRLGNGVSKVEYRWVEEDEQDAARYGNYPESHQPDPPVKVGVWTNAMRGDSLHGVKIKCEPPE